jgi:hypothetical protein
MSSSSISIVGGLSGMMLSCFISSLKLMCEARLVDDQPHRPFGRVGAHVDHRAGEAPIGHDRHGDQQLPVEVGIVAGLAFPWKFAWWKTNA